MKWFKHESRSHADEVMRDLILRYGVEAYAVYMICLELISEKIDERSIAEIKISRQVLKEKTRLSDRKLTEILSFFDQNSLIFAKKESEYWILNCPKLLKRLDNHTKNLQVADKKVSLDKDKERDIEKEQEKDKENKNPVSASPDLKKEPHKEPNPNQVDLKDVQIKQLSEPAKHKIYNEMVFMFKNRGWRTDPAFCKPVFRECAGKMEKYDPRELFPYFKKALNIFINTNAEWLSKNAAHRIINPELKSLMVNIGGEA